MAKHLVNPVLAGAIFSDEFVAWVITVLIITFLIFVVSIAAVVRSAHRLMTTDERRRADIAWVFIGGPTLLFMFASVALVLF